MTDYPISFNAEMIQALIDGRKTQARLLVPNPLGNCGPGDRLWVREAFRHDEYHEGRYATYRPDRPGHMDCGDEGPLSNWQPAHSMPRDLSRFTLTVTKTWIGCVRDIDGAGSIAEGIIAAPGWKEFKGDHPREGFANLWNSTHKKHGERWEDYPTVIAMEFTVRVGNIKEVTL